MCVDDVDCFVDNKMMTTVMMMMMMKYRKNIALTVIQIKYNHQFDLFMSVILISMVMIIMRI